MTALLEVRDVSKVFSVGSRSIVALDQLSLTIEGDVPTFVTVAGESGSGKTTLARLMLGFTQPSTGEVLFHGKALLWPFRTPSRTLTSFI